MNMRSTIRIKDNQKTKIIATVGPASESEETLLELVKAGVNVFRLNFSHGTHDNHKKVIDRIVKIQEEYGFCVGILADLQGPKLRIGKIENDGVEVKAGDVISFVNTACVGNHDKAYMSYEQFAKDVKVGEKVLLDDGKLVFEVLETDHKSVVKLKVLFGGILKSNKGVNLPDTKVSLPCLTEKDLEDLDFILTQPVNWIALSFVRKASDIMDLKERIAAKNHTAKVVAKIEKPEAIQNIKSIINAADAIMVARGDLGVEVPMEMLPPLQKQIIKKCIQNAKPVIVATQMMESMITNPSPTRAEITDVANAVLDGADCLMLSGETATGNHPVKVIDAMIKIIDQAEANYEMQGKRPKPDPDSDSYFSDTICINAPKIADEIKANGITGVTVTGYTAFKMSSYRPKCYIYIFSDRRYLLNTLSMVWGVKGLYYDKFTTTDETIYDISELLKTKGYINSGDVLVNTGSMPLHKRFKTNMLKITIVE